MRPLLCRIFGHRYGEGHLEHGYYQIGTCLRCDIEVCPADDPTCLWWQVKGWVRWRWDRVKRRWRGCPDCGRRFTRCPDDDRHLPF